MVYLFNAAETKRLGRLFQNWYNFYGRLLVITAMVSREFRKWWLLEKLCVVNVVFQSHSGRIDR
jgi:hypothetical protein